MQCYNATANGYDELHGEEQNAKYNSVLEKVNVTDGVVLDVGCGSGLFFKMVAAQANILVGVDLSVKLLEKAKEQARNFENVFVLQADADHLPFKNGMFDYVFAFTTLQNMPNPSDTLVEIKRAVKSTGRVVVTALKKALSLPKFIYLLEAAGFVVVCFIDSEALRCYVSVLVENTCTSAMSPLSA